MPPFLSPTCRKATRIKKSEESQTTSTAKLGDITHKLKILITVTRLTWYWFLWSRKQKEDAWASDGPENSWILTSPTCTQSQANSKAAETRKCFSYAILPVCIWVPGDCCAVMSDDAENHLGPINSFLLPLYTLKTNRLKPSLMTKSHTGTWRVESKLIRTGILGTKKGKLQTKMGLEDGGSGDLKKYKRVCVCACICVI